MSEVVPSALAELKAAADTVNSLLGNVDKYSTFLRGIKLATVSPTMLTAAVQMLKPDADWNDNISAKFLDVAKHFNEDDLDVFDFMKKKGASVAVSLVTNRPSVAVDHCPSCGLVRYNIT